MAKMMGGYGAIVDGSEMEEEDFECFEAALTVHTFHDEDEFFFCLKVVSLPEVVEVSNLVNHLKVESTEATNKLLKAFVRKGGRVLKPLGYYTFVKQYQPL